MLTVLYNRIYELLDVVLECMLRRRKILLTIMILVFFAVLFIFATLFSYFENTGFWRAVYWALVTMTTVGYGDIVPVTDAGRTIAALTMMTGVVLYFIYISVLSAVLVEMAENRKAGKLRLRRTNHIVIIGSSPAAEALIKELISLGTPVNRIVVVSESKPKFVEELGVSFVSGDILRRETLQRASTSEARLIAVMEDDDTKTALVTLTVRSLNPRAIIVAEAVSGDWVDMIHNAGANIVIPSRHLAGRMLAHAIKEPGVPMLIEEASKETVPRMEFIEIEARPYKGMKFIDVLTKLRSRGQTVIAVRRGTQLIPSPPDDFTLDENDILVVVTIKTKPK